MCLFCDLYDVYVLILLMYYIHVWTRGTKAVRDHITKYLNR